MTHLFNGRRKENYKHPIHNRNCNEIVDNRLFEVKLEPDKIPMPTELLKHDLDKDTVLQDTILGLCDKNGLPLRYTFLTNDLDNVMDCLQGEEFFDNIPMPDEFLYFTARDWLGCPISKSEMDAMTFNRKIYEKRALEERMAYKLRVEKGKRLRAESLKKLKTATFEEKPTTLTF